MKRYLKVNGLFLNQINGWLKNVLLGDYSNNLCYAINSESYFFLKKIFEIMKLDRVYPFGESHFYFIADDRWKDFSDCPLRVWFCFQIIKQVNEKRECADPFSPFEEEEDYSLDMGELKLIGKEIRIRILSEDKVQKLSS